MTNWKQGEEGGGMLGRGVCSLGGLMRVLMLMLAALPCLGQAPTAPELLPYQGTLVNGDGIPLGSPTPKNYDVVFRIYDAPSGGTLLWTEQQTVTVEAGRFSVQLGLGGPHNAEARPSLGTVFQMATASDRYLETTVKKIGPGQVDSTLAARTRLLPSPFAMVARHARSAERIVNSSLGGVISIVGARVGINTTNPVTSMEVVGSAQADSMEVLGNAVVGETATAASWTGGGAAPVGSVILWSGTAAERPDGWAFCDGSVVNGYRTPDLRNRFVLGAGQGDGLTERKVGDVGGSEVHALTAEETGDHPHTVDPPSTMSGDPPVAVPGIFGLPGWLKFPPAAATSDLTHTHSFLSEVGAQTGDKALTGRSRYPGVLPPESRGAGPSDVSLTRFGIGTGFSGKHAHTLDFPSTESDKVGSGVPHPNVPPFYVLAYLVRVQ